MEAETGKYIKYRKGYKYQLAEDFRIKIDIFSHEVIKTDFIEIQPGGVLFIKNGYAWDGPSGPTIDTKDFMRGSLVHDALYQLMRMELLDPSWKSYADDLLKKVCLEDGMFALRAYYVYVGVDKGADSAIDPKNRKKVIIAPKQYAIQ